MEDGDANRAAFPSTLNRSHGVGPAPFTPGGVRITAVGVKKAFGLALVGAWVVLLSQACGSSDDKKTSPGAKYTSGAGQGGEGGESSGNSGTQSTGGMSGESSGGQSTNGEGGRDNTPGGAGGADVGDGCEPGFAECDGDPATICEQDLNLVTSCGDCHTTCDSTNASVVCENQTCVPTCKQGFADCNGSPDDACEVDLKDNDEHCGSCTRWSRIADEASSATPSRDG